MADAKRRRMSQMLKDTRFSGVSSAGEVGLRDTARGFEDKYPSYDTYGTPISKGAITAGEKKIREKMNLLRDKEEVDKDAAKAAREAGAEERREARGMKSGGSVSPSKKVLAKSGFYDKGKTKSEREKIVGKVTTKPQRVKMVEKMLSTKKPKRYAEGGLAGLADSANSLMGEVDGMANTINYGSSNASSATEPLGFSAVSGFKKGGTVKSSASKRGDGIALRGKTRGKVV